MGDMGHTAAFFNPGKYDEVLAVLVPQGPLSLVGLSYGGWLTSQYALGFPQRLHRVVLLALAAIEDKALQGLMVPAIFLVGEHEKTYSALRAVSRLNRVAPQIKTEIIPQAGHDLWIRPPQSPRPP